MAEGFNVKAAYIKWLNETIAKMEVALEELRSKLDEASRWEDD